MTSTQTTKLTDAQYVAETLKPAAMRYLDSLPTPTPKHVEAMTAIRSWLDAATVEEWMTAYQSVGLVGKHLTQEIAKMAKARA